MVGTGIRLFLKKYKKTIILLLLLLVVGVFLILVKKSLVEFNKYESFIEITILSLGLLAAFLSIINNTSNNKKLATLQLIIDQRNNKDLNDSVNIMAKEVKKQKDKDHPDLSHCLNDINCDSKEAIKFVLNYREFVAAAINNEIIDENLYKDCFYNIVVRDWDYLKNTVNTLRSTTEKNGKSTLFQEFQILAERWKKKPLKAKVKT